MLLVQCDFDDTISIGNVSVALREAFCPDGWRAIEREYHDGKHSVEESNILQYALMRVTSAEIERFVESHVAVRDGFADFAQWCRANSVLLVVSSGLELYVRPTMRRLGLNNIEVHAGLGRVSPSGILVEYFDPRGRPLTRGYKESYLREFKRLGHRVVYVGDGLSDIVPSTEADVTIARSTLAARLAADEVPHRTFETFDDVRAEVESVRRETARGPR